MGVLYTWRMVLIKWLFNNLWLHLSVFIWPILSVYIDFFLDRSSTVVKVVAGSIPAGVSVVLIDIKSFRSHYGLQPLTEISIWKISWG